MSESYKKQEKFLGAYFDRDSVLRISRSADVLGWIILVVYVVSWILSLLLFLAQFYNGLFITKGMTFLDLFSFFKPYVTEPIPGILYFFALQAISKGLLIFLDIEDNTRRAARK
ncbi:MAG TPA: hypothetical protein DCX53_11950 [Anaerolineae bacterium]|nr:hypothetical protein [Anaerolineae bacterium]